MNPSEVVTPRRTLLAGMALSLGACAAPAGPPPFSAMEALEREHGVLRRVMVLYRECAALLRANFSGFDGKQLWRAAEVVRAFGEGCHEPLEEAHVFPQALKAGGEAALVTPTLIAQHARGREITAFVQAKSAAGGIAGGDAAPLAEALDSFSRMYEAHAAYEDTIVFQAWRRSLTAGALADAAGQFLQAEAAAFKGGFDAALADVAAIETALGLHDLSRYTAPPPGAPAAGVLPTPVPAPADSGAD